MFCNSNYRSGKTNLMCMQKDGHRGPHSAGQYRWDWAVSGFAWVETPDGPQMIDEYLKRRETVDFTISPPRPAAAVDDTPCGAGGYFNNDRVTCSRDHGHFGPHRAYLPDSGYNVMQGSNLGPHISHKLAVIWESR